MRGLKQILSMTIQRFTGVASFTDAWIETLFLEGHLVVQPVASFTDAWIETVKRLHMH